MVESFHKEEALLHTPRYCIIYGEPEKGTLNLPDPPVLVAISSQVWVSLLMVT